MLYLKKIIAPFLLPPGLFILLLITLGLFFIFFKKRQMAWAFLGPAALVWIFSIGPTADLLMAPLEDDFPVPSDFQADVIIMLGGSAYLGVEDLSGTGAPGPGTMERLVTAARLQRRLDIPIILSGGRVFSISASSAWLARRFLLDLGIPENRIIVESKSRDTYENALFSRNICRQYGFRSPLLVSSGYHLKRAMLSFEKAGLKVTPFPCALTTWPDKTHQWYDYLPSAGALLSTSAALHEWIGCLFYRLAV